MLYNELSMGKKTPKIAPSPWDFVTLLVKDRATAKKLCKKLCTSNMHKNLVKIARADRQTDRQTHTHTDVLITILCYRSRGQRNDNETKNVKCKLYNCPHYDIQNDADTK